MNLFRLLFKDNRQFLIYYPPGSIVYNDEVVSNSEIAKKILETLNTGGDIAIPKIDGWQLFQNIQGVFVEIEMEKD